MAKYMLPQTEEFTAKMIEECKKEFLDSPDGAAFREAYDRLEREMENLHNQMDAHIYNRMMAKYGV